MKRIKFRNKEGKTLKGILHLSNKRLSPFAVFAHCFTCSKNLKSVSSICKELVRNGISVLRFDFTGLGESEGDFAETNFSTNVDDIVSATRYLENNYSQVKLLIGHSLGGAAVLQSAHRVPSCRAVVTIGAPADPSHVLKHIESRRSEVESEGEAVVKISGRNFKIKKHFLDDLEKSSMKDKISNLRKALLVMHAPGDNIVGIDNASNIFLPAKHPKSFVTLDTADHLISDRSDAVYTGCVISSWAKRYIFDTQDMDHENGKLVAVNDRHSFATYIYTGDYLMVSDEPDTSGGEDLGPDPYMYLLSSLGSCTAMTLRMYAERKGIPLEFIRVFLAHKKIHASDCAECETEEGRVDYIEKEIELNGELSDEQRSRLMEIAEKCPVNRSLKSEVFIKSTLR